MGIFVSKFLNAAQHFATIKFQLGGFPFGFTVSTSFIPIFGRAFDSLTESEVEAFSPVAFTIIAAAFNIVVNTLDPGSTVVLTLRKNGVDTGVTFTIDVAQGIGYLQNTTFNINVNAADRLAWAITKTGGGSLEFNQINLIGKVAIA